jgi:hypothetical protein
MELAALVISIIALIIAIVAYYKVGGVADLKKQTEVLTNVGETMVKATDSLRDKTADVLDRMEAAVRGTEVREEAPQTERKRGSGTKKREPKAEKKK